MNPLKTVIVIAAIAAAGVAAWQFSPAFRAKARTAFEDYGAWTEEARRDDPVGYIDFATGKLENDLEKFKQAQGTLAQAKTSAQSKLAESESKHAMAVEFSELMRAEYQKAEAGEGYPVEVLQKSYARTDLISQVELVLAERDTYAGVIADYQGVLSQLEETRTSLTTRITTTQAQITQLKAKREVVAIQKLTSETEDLLAKVQDLLGENEETISSLPEDDNPVRTVEDLLNAVEGAAGEAAPDEPAKSAVEAFLES